MVAAHFFDYGLESDHFPAKTAQKTKGGAPERAATYHFITQEKTNSLEADY